MEIQENKHLYKKQRVPNNNTSRTLQPDHYSVMNEVKQALASAAVQYHNAEAQRSI